MNEIARIASGDLEMRPMLARVSEALYRHFGWEFITFVSIDTAHNRYVCEAVRSDKPTGIHPSYSHGLDHGVVGKVASSGKPIVLDDVRLAKDYIEAIPGARSEVCVPIRYRGRVIAALNIESTRLADFHGQLPMLETIAEQVAGAIESARTYEALMEHATLSEVMSEVSRIALEPLTLDELLQQIVEYIAVHFPTIVPGILLLDETGRYFTLEADTGTSLRHPLKDGEWTIDMGICGRCVRQGEALLIEDLEQDPDYLPGAAGMRAEYVTPIRYRGRILGVLNLESAQPRSFTPKVRQILTSIADQVAGGIEGARLDSALREHTRTIEILNRVSHLATQSVDLHLQLRRITDFLAEELSVAVASILVLDETSTKFIIETMSGALPLGVPGDGDWSIETGVCGRCVRTGEPQLVYADSGDPDYV
ncbi:MAG: GAF domain-containing protein [Gammaproteobacteria bacterium]